MDEETRLELIRECPLSMGLALPTGGEQIPIFMGERLERRLVGDVVGEAEKTAALYALIKEGRSSLGELAQYVLEADELGMHPYELIGGVNGNYTSRNPNARVSMLFTNEKSLDSLEEKMLRAALGEEMTGELGDVHRARIVTPTEADALYVSEFLLDNLTLSPDVDPNNAFRLVEKINGYRARHLKVLYRDQKMELQVRTEADHFHAEMGKASHLSYEEERSRLLH